MSSSLEAEARVLPVLIVAGPSASTLLQAIKVIAANRRLGLLTCDPLDHDTAGFVVHQLAHDPAEITKQIGIIVGNNIVDFLIIKCDPTMPAIAYASLFLPRDDGDHALIEVARLLTTVVAINPLALLNLLVRERPTQGMGSASFIAEQIEFAGQIVFDGNQDDPDFESARAIVRALNPRARVLELSGESLKEMLDDTRMPFDFAAAVDGAGWRKLIDAEGDGTDAETALAFTYRARRPFHPERFWNLLQSSHAGLFRAKGFFWLATRSDQVGGLNLAGSEFQVAPAGKWWAARDEHVRRAEMPERTRKEWKEPFGDRRQALAFMGIDCDPHRLRSQLDDCLLTDLEMAGGQQSWRALPDPFPSWAGESHHHECGHDHDGEEHDCCHH